MSHPKIWLSVPIVREKIVKYSQFHVDDVFKAKMDAHLPFSQFDGAAEMWVLESRYCGLPRMSWE